MNPPPAHTSDHIIRVMLVDDSSIIRSSLAKLIQTDPQIEVVQSIENGQLAITAARTSKPDVIILDVEMPVMDGITALPKIIQASPESKVVMFSTLTERGADISLKALSLGAVECLAKPTVAQNSGVGDIFKQQLIHTIKSLVPLKKKAIPIQRPSLNTGQSIYKGKPDILAIGSSTGGPQALFEVMKNFKGLDIPIVLTQHMPATFTKMLANHIQTHSGVMAHEGEERMRVQNGHVYVAPGGKHMLIKKDREGPYIHLNDGPPENFCKPSVDPMFRSVIDIYGDRVLGVILTGMGNDGLPSSKDLVAKGGRLIAQDEKTSVVWGMPRAVAEAGLCSEILPLTEIGPWVKKAIMG